MAKYRLKKITESTWQLRVELDWYPSNEAKDSPWGRWRVLGAYKAHFEETIGSSSLKIGKIKVVVNSICRVMKMFKRGILISHSAEQEIWKSSHKAQ